MNSLATKLSLAFIVVVVVGVASVSLLVRRETEQSFNLYLEAGGRMYAERVVETLELLYRESESWEGAGSLLESMVRGRSDRMVLADGSGRIVADTSGQLVGESARAIQAGAGYPVEVNGRREGTLYVVAPDTGFGTGQPRGRGAMAGKAGAVASGASTQQAVSSLEARFLESVDRAILTAAAFAGLLAMIIGVAVARRITSPLAELSGAAQEVATGRLDRRVRIESGDEVGQVGRAFNAMAESLDRNEQARRRLVADIAHDLRTPLTVIEGTVDGMLDGVFEPDRANLESVREEVGLLTKLVADLRTISLVEAGQLKLETELVDPVELAQRSVARVESIAQRKGVACRVEIDRPVPPIYVDPDRMAQVLGNLLDNALRHTPEGGSVIVQVGRTRAGGECAGWKTERPAEGGESAERVALAVTDTGEGIPPEAMPYLFDRFYRADESRTRSKGGSGLGLAIVKQLVEAHGGQVCAESGVGRGSRFVVELPAATAP
jgi:signal transduction histidine kinase